MGIPGILKEIGKGERTALAKLAVEHLEKTQRPLRVAIDGAIWNFQNQAGQGGKNPALRTLFFRLLKLLALPIHPVFVYDGKHKPLTKRGRTVSRYSTCIPNETAKQLIQAFRFPHHVAPGEAEAECAFLQRNGVVDAVMSQDVDAIMFGSTLTLRDWSKEGTRGNKTPTHVNVLDSSRIKTLSGLDPDGMILVALLSGGDYDEAGIPGFGSTLACEIARAGFGADLLDLVRRDDTTGLEEWRQRLQYELETNESGYFRRRHKTLKVPHNFPNLTILDYYTQPAVSKIDDLLVLKTRWAQVWDSEIDVPALREYTANTFDWGWRSGACRFVRCFAQPLFQDRLRRGTVSSSAFEAHNISERRQHFINDGIPELRLSVTPADVVGIDIGAEEQNPDCLVMQNEEEDEDGVLVEGEKEAFIADVHEEQRIPASPSKRKTSLPWDPYTSEKWWIPETILQLGLPAIVEEWHQLQRDIRADSSKRVITRKTQAPPKARRELKRIDAGMQTGAIRQFFSQTRKLDLSPKRSDTQVKKLDSGASHMLLSEDVQLPGTSQTDTETQICSPSTKRGDVAPEESEAENAGQRKPSHSTDDSKLLLWDAEVSKITQRRPRRTKVQAETSASPPSSRSRRLRPIESFFTQTDSLSLPGISNENRQLLPAFEQTETLQQEIVGQRSHSTALRRAALARESLPGTWVEAEAERKTSKVAPRVSYIDLASD